MNDKGLQNDEQILPIAFQFKLNLLKDYLQLRKILRILAQARHIFKRENISIHGIKEVSKFLNDDLFASDASLE